MIDAGRMDIWKVISDPYHLARWWPRAKRIEDVRERRRGTQWTQVFETRSGRDIRADFRCLLSRDGEQYSWEQEIAAGSPFAKLLRTSVTSIELEDADHAATRVSIVQAQKLRGINRFGGFIARHATQRQLDEALDGLEQAVSAEPEAGSQ